jgi:hypothetical protein
MRNIVFFASVIFFFIFFSSCTKDPKVGPGISKTVTDTVTYFCSEPVLADRFSCATGAVLGDPKVIDWETKERTITKEVECKFSDEELNAVGYTYTGKTTRASRPERIEEEGFTPTPVPDSGTKKSNSGWSIPENILKGIGLVIIALLLLWLLLWILREFFNWFNQPRNNTHVLRDRQTEPITPNSGPVVQSNPEPKGTFVPAGYMLIPAGTVVVPYNGIYLGVRGTEEGFRGEISPQNKTSVTSNSSENTKEAEQETNTQT